MWGTTVDGVLKTFTSSIKKLEGIAKQEGIEAELRETEAGIHTDRANKHRKEAGRANMLAHKFSDFIMV